MLAVDLETKRFSLLRELVPTARTVGVLLDAAAPDADLRSQNFQLAARNFSLPIRKERVSSAREFETAFAAFEREQADAVVVGASTFFNTHRDLLVGLTLRHRLPAIFELREFVEAGGLLSYSPSLADAFRQAGSYTGRILKGEKTADLPVLLPTKFEMAINAKAAKALGLSIPRTILLSADEVIE
jgi:putative ABC transport system substrate-binding protein